MFIVNDKNINVDKCSFVPPMSTLVRTYIEDGNKYHIRFSVILRLISNLFLSDQRRWHRSLCFVLFFIEITYACMRCVLLANNNVFVFNNFQTLGVTYTHTCLFPFRKFIVS